MDLEIAREKDDDDHYANYGEDIHSALLLLLDRGAWRARTLRIRRS